MKVQWLYILLLMTSLTAAEISTILVVATNATYTARVAAFGPRLLDPGKLGLLMEPEQDITGCTVVEKPCEDWIALIRRGGCSFVTKVRKMQQSGAIAVIVGDPNPPYHRITMYAPGNTSDVQIPSAFLARPEYQSLQRELQSSEVPLLIFMHPDNLATWPLIDLLLVVIMSPTVMTLFIFISWRIRQQKMQQRKLAHLHLVTSLATKTFSREKLKENDREECAICLEDYADGDELRILPCQHDFHTQCVGAWLTRQKELCPICKRDITCGGRGITSEETPLLLDP